MNLLSASRGKQILIDQEAVTKQTEAIKSYTPLPLQHHETYPSGYHYDSITHYTYHITPSSQAILCQDIHLFTKLIDVPLRLLDYLDPVTEHQQQGLSTPPHKLARWRFTNLESPQVATSSTPKVETPLRLTHTPEVEYQSALLSVELEEPTDPSSSDSDSDSDSDNDSMAGDKENKMNPPPEFSGSTEKARDFLWQVDLYITCKKDQFKDNTARIVWTLSFIRGGPGGVWAGEYIDQLTAALDPNSTTTPPTWKQFRTNFTTKFFPKNETQEVRNKLKCLLQRRSSAQDYVTGFNTLAAMTDYPEVALIEAFKDGMVPSLKQMIMVTRDTLPIMLEKWQDLAVCLDQNKRTNKYEISLKQGRGRYLYPIVSSRNRMLPKGMERPDCQELFEPEI